MKYNKVICHRNGAVTYWSVFFQQWMEDTFHVPWREIDAMNERNRKRVINHIEKHKEKYPYLK